MHWYYIITYIIQFYIYIYIYLHTINIPCIYVYIYIYSYPQCLGLPAPCPKGDEPLGSHALGTAQPGRGALRGCGAADGAGPGGKPTK